MINFKINVAAPTEDANIVVPMNVPNADGFYAGSGPCIWFLTINQ